MINRKKKAAGYLGLGSGSGLSAFGWMCGHVKLGEIKQKTFFSKIDWFITKYYSNINKNKHTGIPLIKHLYIANLYVKSASK